MSEQKAKKGNISSLPDDIGLKYIPGEVSLRRKQKARAFVTDSYVEKVRIYEEDEGIVSIRAEVYPSVKKSDPRHAVTMEIDKKMKTLKDSICTCQQGASGACSHVVAILYLLELWKISRYKDVPAMLSCTSQQQRWGKPRGAKIQPEPVAQMVFASPLNTSRKRKPIMAKFNDNRNVEVNNADILALKRAKSCPVSYLTELISDNSNVDTPAGPQILGSYLAYQIPLIKPITTPKDADPCGNIQFPKEIQVEEDMQDYLDLMKDNWKNCHLKLEESHELERRTRQQAGCKEWHDSRRHRLTASKFGDVMSRKKAVNDAFLRQLLSPKSFKSVQTSYGQSNEKTAKTKYLQESTNLHIHDIGFLVNPAFPFIGASPDGVVCENGSEGLIEIKCPYTARDMTLTEAARQIPSFFLAEDGKLNENHKHFFQVQGQLLVSGANFCDFIVYTRKDFSVQRIYPDQDVHNRLLEKLVDLYVQKCVPYIQTMEN